MKLLSSFTAVAAIASFQGALACEMPCRYGISNAIVQQYANLLQPIFNQFTTSDVDMTAFDFTAWTTQGAAAKQQLTTAIQSAQQTYFTQATAPNSTLAQAVLTPVFAKYRGTCPTTAGCPNYNCPTVCGSPGSVIANLDDALSIAKNAILETFQKTLPNITTTVVQQAPQIAATLSDPTTDPVQKAFEYASMTSNMAQIAYQLGSGLEKLDTGIKAFCPNGCEAPFKQTLISTLSTYP